MIITRDSRPAKVDPIATHKYVRPIVREVSPVAPASSALEANRRATAARRRPLADDRELERIVMAAKEGDRAAIAAVVERFAPRVRIVARAHRLAAHDIEDVMQTTWLQLLQHVHTIRDPTAVGAWLETTARRESLRILKNNSRERPTDDELVFDAPRPPVDQQPPQTPERCTAALAMAVEQLPDHQRDLLSMLFADPSPRYAEVSRALGIPIGSIGPTRARSLRRLRENQHLGDVVEEYLLDTL
jgi:RNA polymerase sigma factor (sigma-70 family)